MYKVESDFTYKGYRCVVVFQDMGHRCGYVGIDADNPLYGKQYSDYLDIKKSDLEGKNIGKRGVLTVLSAAFDDNENVKLELYFDVHGGLTYSDSNSNYPVESNLWWLGFDCAHCDDAYDLDLVNEYFGENPRIRERIQFEQQWPIFGEIRTKEYVENECRSLVDQIIELLSKEDDYE